MTEVNRGDADIARVADLFADQTRARVLMALIDGRALPASVLAAEAGVTPQAASTQLARLRDAGLISAERSGRHRYYRLASPHVAVILEALAGLAPSQPIRSLRQGTRAAALRAARTCYDHLAGRLGVAVTQALVDRGALIRRDGVPDTVRRPTDPLSSQLADHPYALGESAIQVFGTLGVEPLAAAHATRRPLLRFCLDWSEQRHHLAGRLGADLLTAMTTAGWITRIPRRRAVRLTDRGAGELRARLGVAVDGQ